MAEKYELTKVYYPTSLNDLLALANSKPKAVIFSGGTYLLRNQSSRSFRLPETVIALHTVEELRKIGRTEARIDVGATATIEQILKTGRKMLPKILVDTLEGSLRPDFGVWRRSGGTSASASGP
jgi:CO/xanthine dehydrogenase FAD-binding subunit